MSELTGSLIHNLCETDDPDLVRDAVSGTTLRVDRLSRPSSVSHMEQFQSSGGWVLDTGDLQCRLHAEGAFPAGSVGVMLVWGAPGTSCCGVPLDDGMLVSFPGGLAMEFNVSPGFSYAGTQVPMTSWVSAQLLETGFVREGIGVRRLPPEQLATTRGRLAAVIEALRAAADGPVETDTSEVIEEHVSWLAQDAAGLDEVPAGIYAGNLQRVAAQARDWIHAHVESPIRITDVCRAIGVSRRKLEYAFRAAFDVSPQEFIQIVRLNEIHRALADSRSSNRSVTDVALQYGINHFGRFAASYRDLFGELPRETRMAARARQLGNPPRTPRCRA